MTATPLLDAVRETFAYHKRLADGAIAQVADDRLRQPLDEHTNSIAVVMRHVAGNLRSRWTDVLTTDGEKPWRDRDGEFVDTYPDRAAIVADWESGWACLFESLGRLTDGDLGRTVVIRGEAMPLAVAATRSLGHTCYHVGQIVILARHHAGPTWTTLTVPRGGSARYNQTHWGDARPAS